MAKKMLAILGVAIIILLLSTGTIATGCSNNSGKEIEVDGWLLYKFSIISDWPGRVNILAVNDESLVVDGVLNIPAKIGKYKISGFGIPSATWSSRVDVFDLPRDIHIERVVLAAELEITNSFSGAKYVEFLSATFEKVHVIAWYEDRMYIIPDGSTEKFVDRIAEAGLSSETYNFMEKSKFLEENQNG